MWKLKSIDLYKSSIVAPAALLMALGVACGQTPQPESQPAPAPAPAPATPTATSSDACVKVTGDGGVELCQTTKSVYPAGTTISLSPSFFPKLTEGAVASGYSTGFKVHVGDRMTFSASGRYGRASDSDGACVRSTLDGYRVDKDFQQFYGTLPSALFASDGKEMLQLGNSGVHYISNDGVLRWGFNSSGWNDVCGSFVIYSWTVQHCEDSSGKTQTCPNA